jgi:hypothetical protein
VFALAKKQFSISGHSIHLSLQQTLNYRGEQMPSRKIKNDNKEKELIDKQESIEEEREDTAEQINIEEELDESERPK